MGEHQTDHPFEENSDLMTTLKVRASLLSGCLQMMTTQTPQSRVRMAQGTTTAGWPLSSSGRKLARMMHSTVMKTAAEAGQKIVSSPTLRTTLELISAQQGMGG